METGVVVAKKKSSHLGLAFEGEIAASARHLGYHYQKLMVGTMGANSRFTLKSPYDSFFVQQGRHHALELKSLKEHGSFPLANIAPHQIDGLRDAHQAGAAAFLLVNMRRQRAKINNQAWALSIEYWDELLAILEQRKRKSIPYEFFTQHLLFQEIPRIRIPDSTGKEMLVWDLSLLLGIVLPVVVVEEKKSAPVELSPDDPDLDPQNPWALPSIRNAS